MRRMYQSEMIIGSVFCVVFLALWFLVMVIKEQDRRLLKLEAQQFLLGAQILELTNLILRMNKEEFVSISQN